MIPLAKTVRPEAAANALIRHYRHVLIQAHYDNLDSIRIRFRPDMLQDDRVYFAKVPSQIRRWRERGGILVSWRRVDEREGSHDAILFAECPKSIEGIYKGMSLTRHLGVVYQPPTWRPHEETIALRCRERHPRHFLKRASALTIVRDFVAGLPTLSRDFLSRRPTSQVAASLPSCAPGSPAGAALLSDKPR